MLVELWKEEGETQKEASDASYAQPEPYVRARQGKAKNVSCKPEDKTFIMNCTFQALCLMYASESQCL